MRPASPFVVLCGLAVTLGLAGCAGSSQSAGNSKPAATPSAQSTAPAPAPVVADAKPVRDASGHLVTLADLTGHGPTIGQTEGLADSTPGEVALGTPEVSGASSDSDDNLEIVDTALRGKVAVLRVGSGRSDSNLLSVFAGVKNRTAHRLDLEMQTVYRDKDGRPLSAGRASWVPITLKPHEETQYRSVAISEDAADFVVRIRHAPDPDSPQPNP